MTTVLTREIGLKENTLPTGRKLEVVGLSQAGLYKIKAEGAGTLPKKFAGTYTSRPRAESDMKKYLREFWDTSDSVKRKEK